MEQMGLRSSEIPKFNSPQEEINYLRAHLQKREAELGGESTQEGREKIADQTIREYKAIPIGQVLPQEKILSEEKSEAIILALKPEAHDKKIEELLGIIVEHGLKNALSIVEKMNSAHLDNDFHRFLVQYLASTHSLPGLKEGTEIAKSLHMKLFEITLPAKDEEDSRGFKELLNAMEQFFAGMQSVGDGRDNHGKFHYTLEIALSNSSDEVIFYSAIPESKADLFEKQILSVHKDAKVREVTDDYNIFTEGGASAAAFAGYERYEVFPIKLYETFEHDPLNVILNIFSKLKREGEGAAIQLVIQPQGTKFIHDFNEVLEEVKQGESAAKRIKFFSKFDKAFGKAVKELVVGYSKDESKEKEKEKKRNEDSIKNITEKVKSSIMAVNIRIVASAETKDRAKQILQELESAFHQFNDTNSNGFVFSHVTERGLPDLLHEYSYRLYNERETLPLNLKELSTVFHFPYGISSAPQLKEAQAAIAPAPREMASSGIVLGTNMYRGEEKQIVMSREDRVRHMYVIGQTGTGKTVFLKNMIIQDIKNGDGCCFIDPHGSDIQDILANIPKERIDDVIYFDPAYTARPMGLNMLEFDANYPEQKTFVVNELLAIFNKLFDMKTAGGPAFEQYFRNSALLVMEHPESGSTLLEIGRVLADKEFRDMKLSHCKNPIISQFWENAERTTGEQSLANFVPYITNKFDVFVSNDIMRPIIAQQKSVFNFRDVMDQKKILLVNLSKGRLGDINSSLIGLILVGKITMAALSRVDIVGSANKVNDFYLYIDEFQNVTTDSISTILSEARKYRLSLTVAHQYIEQLEENIKNAVFGNVGTMVVHRVSPENAEVFAKIFEPVFKPTDIIKLENLNCYIKMLVNGMPAKPFNSHTPFPPKGNPEMLANIKELSYLRFGRPRDEVEGEVMERYRKI